MHLFPHIPAVQIQAVAVRISARNRLAEQFPEQDVGECLDDRGGRAFEQIAHADVEMPWLDLGVTVRIGETAEFHPYLRYRGTGLQVTENAEIDLPGRLKQEGALDLHASRT